MLSLAATAAFIGLALLHAPPALAARSAKALRGLYGEASVTDHVVILLRHRAAQFALVALLCALAAAWPPARSAALVVAAWSMASFLVVYGLAGAPTGPLRKIAVADAAAAPLLALAAAPFVVG